MEKRRFSTSVVTPICQRVVAPPALVAPQHFERADVEPEPVRVDDRLRQRRGVAEAEIEPLPGDRMDAVRGVAEKREARAHEIARQRQAERIGAARALELDRAEPMAEAALELHLEDEIVAAIELRRVVARAPSRPATSGCP